MSLLGQEKYEETTSDEHPLLVQFLDKFVPKKLSFLNVEREFFKPSHLMNHSYDLLHGYFAIIFTINSKKKIALNFE